MAKHIPVYRPIFKQALTTAWRHKELWPLAALAGLAGTGVVINDLLSQAKLAASLPTANLRDALVNQSIFNLSWDQIFQIGSGQLTLGLLLGLTILGLGIFVITACQQVMLKVVHTALKRKTYLHGKELRQAFLHPKTFSFLALDVFVKLFVSNLMIATSVLMLSLDFQHKLLDGFFGLIFVAAVLALALSVNILVMLALVGLTRQDFSLSQALSYAWKTYTGHAALCIEISIMLFAANFLLSTAYQGALIILGVPTVFTFIAALSTGSTALYSILFILVIVCFLIVTIMFGGFATTFTYAVWVDLAERLEKKPVVPRVIAHTKHLLKVRST